MINVIIQILAYAIIIASATFVVFVVAAMIGQWRKNAVKECEREVIFNAFEEAQKRSSRNKSHGQNTRQPTGR